MIGPLTLGVSLLAPLTRNQVNCIHARLGTAGEDLYELLYGENRVDDENERRGLRALLDEVRDLSHDVIGAMDPATEREIGADRQAAAIQRNHLADLAKAEQLLSAERAS